MVAARNTAQPRAVPFHHCAYRKLDLVEFRAGDSFLKMRTVRLN